MKKPLAFQQPIDLSRVFDGMERALTEKYVPSKSPQKQIRQLRGRNFFFCAAHEAKETGIRAAQRFYAEDTFHQNCDGFWIHNNRFGAYKQGRFGPSKATAKAASKKAGVDLAIELDRNLWFYVDPKWQVKNQIFNHAQAYDHPTFILLNTLKTWPPSGRTERLHRAIGVRSDLRTACLAVIEQPSLSTLEAFTLAYRWCSGKASPADEAVLGRFILLNLLAVGPELALRGILRPLYDLYLGNVLSGAAVSQWWRGDHRQLVELSHELVDRAVGGWKRDDSVELCTIHRLVFEQAQQLFRDSVQLALDFSATTSDKWAALVPGRPATGGWREYPRSDNSFKQRPRPSDPPSYASYFQDAVDETGRPAFQLECSPRLMRWA